MRVFNSFRHRTVNFYLNLAAHHVLPELNGIAVGVHHRVIFPSHNIVLINPHVIEQESDVSDFDKDNTWGFFDALHERDYENFCCRFNNAAFYPMDDELSLFYIKEIVEAVIEE